MSTPQLLAALAVAYVIASIAYVYRWRGHVRYPSLKAYLQRSWPIFAPLNCLLYLATRKDARKPVLDADTIAGLALLRENWTCIRDEALALYLAGELDATTRIGSPGYHDLGFRTFFKRGWKKFYLTWYGAPHRSAQRLCPQTLQLIARVPAIRAAMFSALPPGTELTLHSDPMACSLRYHLGLATPNSEHCFIAVDGIETAWRDGHHFVFDETYPHHARNDTDQLRLILMCDVERPMHLFGRLFNRLYSQVVAAMAVPNTPEDRRGVIQRVFAFVAPWRATALRLKTWNRPTYLALKFSLNAALISCAALLGYVALEWIETAVQAAVVRIAGVSA